MKIYIAVKDYNEVFTNNGVFEQWYNGFQNAKLFHSETQAEQALMQYGYSINQSAKSQRNQLKSHPQKEIFGLLSQMGSGIRDFVGIHTGDGIGIHEVAVKKDMWLNFGETYAEDMPDIFVICEYGRESIYYLSERKLADAAIIPPEGLYAEEQSDRYYLFQPSKPTIIDVLKANFTKITVIDALEYEVQGSSVLSATVTVEEEGIFIQTNRLASSSVSKQMIKQAFQVLEQFDMDIIIN